MGMSQMLPTQKSANFRINSNQNVTPTSSPYDAAKAASISSAKNSDIMLDPTLSITLESRPSP